MKQPKRPALSAVTSTELLVIVQPPEPTPTLNTEITRLWQTIKIQKHEIQQLEHRFNEVQQFIQQEIVPFEKQHCLEPSLATIERLIALAARKSLADYERQLLADWMTDLLKQLLTWNEHATAMDAQARFNAAMLQGQGITPEDEARDLEQQHQDFKQQWKDAFDEEFEIPPEGISRSEFERLYQNRWVKETFKQFNLDDEPDDLDDDVVNDGHHEEHTHHKRHRSKPESDSALPNPQRDAKGWLAHLFKQTARILHPDRETDPDQRAKKATLMQQLGHARDTQDVGQLLELYMQHAKPTQSGLNEAYQVQIERALEQQLSDIQSKLKHLKQGIKQDPLLSVIHHAKKRQATLRKMQGDIKQRALELDLKRQQHLRNLGTFKAYARAYYAEQQGPHFLDDDFFF